MTVEKAAEMMNDVWASGQLSRRRVPKYVVPCRWECADAPKGEERGRENMQRRRDGLNQEVMRFFLKDWLPEETMAAEEVRGTDAPYDPPTTPPPPPAAVWLSRLLYRGAGACSSGSDRRAEHM